jgi:hypothetical protein
LTTKHPAHPAILEACEQRLLFDVVAKFTFVGDSNLDGVVDALDYQRVDLAIGNTGVFGTAQGDLNYDGNVDALDYQQVDLNIGNGPGNRPTNSQQSSGTPADNLAILGPVTGIRASTTHLTGTTKRLRASVKLHLPTGGELTTTTNIKFYLSANAAIDSSDTLLASVDVPLKLKANRTKTASATFTLPAQPALAADTTYSYRILARADANEQFRESNEADNFAITPISIKDARPKFSATLISSARTGITKLKIKNTGTAPANGLFPVTSLLTNASHNNTPQLSLNPAATNQLITLTNLRPGKSTTVVLSRPAAS